MGPWREVDSSLAYPPSSPPLSAPCFHNTFITNTNKSLQDLSEEQSYKIPLPDLAQLVAYYFLSTLNL